MTDEELVEKLRWYPQGAGHSVRIPAADRIEYLNKRLAEVTAERNQARGQRQYAEEQWFIRARELHKAITALQKVRDFVRDLEPYADQGHTLAPALHDACVILNELEGHKDD